MKTTVEISMYPMRENYIPPIDAVIEKLNSYAELNVETFATATILVGENAAVMNALVETIEWSHAQFGTSVFVAKIIPGYPPANE